MRKELFKSIGISYETFKKYCKFYKLNFRDSKVVKDFAKKAYNQKLDFEKIKEIANESK